MPVHLWLETLPSEAEDRMVCGKVVQYDDEANITEPEHDYVIAVKKLVTCPECLAALDNNG